MVQCEQEEPWKSVCVENYYFAEIAIHNICKMKICEVIYVQVQDNCCRMNECYGTYTTTKEAAME